LAFSDVGVWSFIVCQAFRQNFIEGGKKMRTKSGLTLVEVMIIMVILGILAAIVIPQFSSASTEAKESRLLGNLQAVRSQIELYKIQHNDNLPGMDLSGDFVTAMTSMTDRYGEVGTGAAHKYGPYLKEIPENPFSSLDAPTTVQEGDGTGVGDDSHAWYFNIGGDNIGLFQADDSGVNSLDNDTPHTEY